MKLTWSGQKRGQVAAPLNTLVSFREGGEEHTVACKGKPLDLLRWVALEPALPTLQFEDTGDQSELGSWKEKLSSTRNGVPQNKWPKKKYSSNKITHLQSLKLLSLSLSVQVKTRQKRTNAFQQPQKLEEMSTESKDGSNDSTCVQFWAVAEFKEKQFSTNPKRNIRGNRGKRTNTTTTATTTTTTTANADWNKNKKKAVLHYWVKKVVREWESERKKEGQKLRESERERKLLQWEREREKSGVEQMSESGVCSVLSTKTPTHWIR